MLRRRRGLCGRRAGPGSGRLPRCRRRAHLRRTDAMSDQLLAEVEALKARISSLEDRVAVLPSFTPIQRHMNSLIRAAAAAWGVSPADIIGDRRAAFIVEPRFAVIWVARNALPYSYPQIARVLGDRDPTTILHAV